jgi:outer membrane immunogenic protein
MKYWTLSGVAALASIAAGSAGAADLAPIYKAPPLVVSPWTGFYLGGHIGGGFGNKKFFDNFPTPDGEKDADSNVSGWIGGLQAGYNYQFNRLVLGAEGQFTWSGISNTFDCFAFGDQICSANAEWFAALTARVGVTFGQALFYVKGGPAWVQDTITDHATCAGTQPVSRAGIPAVCGATFVGHDTRFGWTAGGGIEYMFLPNWSAKLEYNYYGFPDKSVGFSDGSGNFFTELIKQNMQTVTVGINYHFGAVAAPAVAPAPYVTKAR